MSIKIKRGVQPDSLMLMAALANTAEIWSLDVTVTSGSDGKHRQGSRHYTDQAIDVRSKELFETVDEKLQFLKRVIERLGPADKVQTPTGPGYQTKDGRWLGILENIGLPLEHFHLERN